MNATTNLFQEPKPLDLDTTLIPPDSALRTVASAVKELAEADLRLKRAEALCVAIQARRTRLATKVLPELMDGIQQDIVGLPSMNIDVVVEPFYHAAIKADWPHEKREVAFNHLETLGGGDLVKAEVSIGFNKEDLPIAKQVIKLVKHYLDTANVSAVTSLDMSVNWRTLTSWMRAEIEKPMDPHAAPTNRPKLNPDLIGGVVGRVCRIVPRGDGGGRKVRGRKKK